MDLGCFTNEKAADRVADIKRAPYGLRRKLLLFAGLDRPEGFGSFFGNDILSALVLEQFQIAVLEQFADDLIDLHLGHLGDVGDFLLG